MGDLSEERLRLAAYCEHPAALLLAPPTQTRRGFLQRLKDGLVGRWVVPGLEEFGLEATVRGLIAGARIVVPELGGLLDTDARALAALEAAEAWAVEPTPARRDLAAAAAHEANGSFGWYALGLGGPPGASARPTSDVAVRLAAIGTLVAPARALGRGVDLKAGESGAAAVLRLRRGGPMSERYLEVQRRIQQEVAAWALGADPLRGGRESVLPDSRMSEGAPPNI